MDTEKRRIKRFELQLPATVKVLDENLREREALEFYTRDISAAGVYLQNGKSLPQGTAVVIDLVLPLDQLRKIKVRGDKVHVRLSGLVVRAEDTGMGICFDEQYEIGSI